MTSIGEVCTVIAGQSPPGASYNADGQGLPFFQGKAEFGQLQPTVRKWTTDGRKLAQANDVLISVRAPVGPTNLAPSECAIGRGLAAVRPLGRVDPKYVLYAFRATSEQLAARATGSTFDAVTGEQVRAHPIALAPLMEQQRIVAAVEEQFSRLDAAAALVSLARKRLKVLMHGLIDEAVQCGHADRALGSLLREPLRNGHSAKASRGNTGVRTLTLSAVTRERFIEEYTKLTSADPSRVEGLWLESGDIFIERSNTPDLVGTAALYRGPARWAIFPDLLIRVRTSGELVPEYLAYVLKSTSARSYFKRRAQGIAGSMPKIDQETVAELPVPVPPLEEQRRIISQLEQQLSLTDSLQSAVESAQKRSAALRRSILQQAFRGELVPQDPDDEPASFLLERIRAERAAAPRPSRRRATMKAS